MAAKRDRFSTAFIAGLKAGPKDVLHYEPGGFGVRVTPAGAASYFFQGRIDGKPRRVVIGAAKEFTGWPKGVPHGAWTLMQARQEADRIRGKVASGENPIVSRQAEQATGVTLSEYWRNFEARKLVRDSTLKAYKAVMERDVLPALGFRTLDSLSRLDATALHARTLDPKIVRPSKQGAPGGKPRAPKASTGRQRAAAKACQVLRAVVGRAWRDGILNDHPLRGLSLPTDNQRTTFLDDQAFAKVEAAIIALEGKGVSLMSAAFLRTMMLSGARGGELQQLRWEMVDPPTQTATIPIGKNGRPRVIPLSGAWEIIEALPRIGPMIFGNGRQPFTQFRQAWRVVREKANIGEDVRPHDLRHSFASATLAQGYSLSIVGHLLGHKNIASSARYAHAAKGAISSTAAEVASAIKSAQRGGTAVARIEKAK